MGFLTKRELGKLVTKVENNPGSVREILKSFEPLSDKSPLVIGITGPQGAGKSTAINGLIRNYRSIGKSIVVLAVDPTSLSGGAFLGDRIRMNHFADDENVFIRSIASRGGMGGLAPLVNMYGILKLVSNSGFDVIFVESVGAGQTSLDIKKLVDLVVLILSPGCGDSIQFMKGGIIEIADIFAINKADTPDGQKLSHDLRSALEVCNFAEIPRLVGNGHNAYSDLFRKIKDFESNHDLTDSRIARKRFETIEWIRYLLSERLPSVPEKIVGDPLTVAEELVKSL
jgi:LAO/AO transport system kinase